MQANETLKFLAKFIQKGDFLELPDGRQLEARTGVQERLDVFIYTGIVSVWDECFGIPLYTRDVQAVWRGNVCVWRLGESFVQRELF